MIKLTDIIKQSLPIKNASVFLRKYYGNTEDALNLYAVERVNYKHEDALVDRKKRFTGSRSSSYNLVIIPFEQTASESIVTYRESNTAMKKFPLLPMFRERSKSSASRYCATPEKKFRQALSMASLEDKFVGYDFSNISGTEIKTVSFTDSLIGRWIADKKDVSLDRNDYSTHPYGFSNGGKINAVVRSQSGEDTHKLRVDSVPIRKSGQATQPQDYANWQNMTTNHDCGKTLYGELSYFRCVKNLKNGLWVKRQIASERKLDQHVIAAVKAYNMIRSTTQVNLDPFIEFKDEALLYYNKLINHTLMEVPEEGRIKLKPLNQVNINLLMWDYIKQNPNQVYFR